MLEPETMRAWNEIVDELVSEPNTGRMAELLKELNDSPSQFEKYRPIEESYKQEVRKSSAPQAPTR